MSFREWLYYELLDDGVIDDTYDEDDLSFNQLITETSLSEEDYEQYKSEFEEHCELISQTPIWDVE